MVIRRKRWLLVVGLFVFAPIAGLMIGVFGGLQLVDSVHDSQDVEPAPVVDSATSVDAADQLVGAEVTLPNGESIQLHEFAPQRKLAVVVMKDASCPVCQDQLKVLSERLDEIEREGGTVIGLSDASTCVNRKLMEAGELNFPIVSDVDHEVLERFEMSLPDRPHVMPGLIFINEYGGIDFVHQGRRAGQHQERIVLDWMQSG